MAVVRMNMERQNAGLGGASAAFTWRSSQNPGHNVEVARALQTAGLHRGGARDTSLSEKHNNRSSKLHRDSKKAGSGIYEGYRNGLDTRNTRFVRKSARMSAPASSRSLQFFGHANFAKAWPTSVSNPDQARTQIRGLSSSE